MNRAEELKLMITGLLLKIDKLRIGYGDWVAATSPEFLDLTKVIAELNKYYQDLENPELLLDDKIGLK